MILTHQERSVPTEYALRPAAIRTAGMSAEDRRTLSEHIARDAIQGCPDRDFTKGWLTSQDGTKKPRCYRPEAPAFGKCQYAVLATPERAAVLVVDVDRPGTAGGGIEHLNAQVRARFDALARAGRGPALVGVNPLNGKCQAIWLVDPVYAGTGRTSPNRKLLDITADLLAQLLGADRHFAGAWSRSPFYQGKDPHAYKWHAQHGHVDRVAALRAVAGTKVGDMETAGQGTKKDEFTSGRELLEAVQARRAESQAARDLLDGLGDDGLSAAFAEVDRRAGVRIIWLSEGRAARDKTAFQHAVAEGYRLKRAGKRVKPEPIIDAYERGYNAAQAAGADGRAAEMPPARDRATMARRVIEYVATGRAGAPTRPESASGRVSPAQRAALVTLGSRGGRKAAERWETDPKYREAALAPLRATQGRKSAAARSLRARILATVAEADAQGVARPTRAQIAAEVGAAVPTVDRHLRALREAGLLPER